MALKTWESTFEPLLDASQWSEYNGDEYVPDCGLLKQKVGRRKRKRLRNEMDDSSKGYGEDMYGAGDFDEAPIKIRCSICHRLGHRMEQHKVGPKNNPNRRKRGNSSSGEVDLRQVEVHYPLSAMAHPDYPLLETFYDREHRAHLMVDDGEVLSPLRICTHNPLRWDERYAQYIGRAGFLPLARLVTTGLSMFDNAALTALVDRWRPETHTFHLPCGELTVTLQDVAMILGLPIDSQPVCGNVQPAGWRDMVELIVGTRPPEPAQDAKDKKPSGVSSAWLAQNFTECPHDAAEHVVESGDHANLGGCTYLLQVWMWERLPIGRPDRFSPRVWQFEDEGSLPTVAFLWRNVRAVTGNAGRRYLFYTNELDCIMQSHVTWEPYERHKILSMGLSPLCTRDMEYWRSVLPLICFYIVKMHCPNHVMRQFGILQRTPPDTTPTSVALHKIDRRKQHGARDWRDVHHNYLVEWSNRAQTIVHGGPAHRSGPYREYLRWLHDSSRLAIKPPRVAVAAENLPDSDDEDDLVDEYDQITRHSRQPERAPLHNYIVFVFCHIVYSFMVCT
ncbi:serine/threonine-protein phosphatase 7 long form homolog [Phragmites australis]|uniref:serine/threonine-protein phosphatase 7 long form homolog n=1 Tax=Phragmites australis TaxID=29695 RepID=UPI002D764F1B|nr:serine/threonine-protein phosphatase 7 long form homolog [Phragmites australis]